MQNDLISLNDMLEEKVLDGINELRERDKILVQQARFAQMGELLAMIAHQWRQPLSAAAAIVSNLKISIALGEQNSEEELLKQYESIDEHIALLSSTIDDFRNFFRSDKHMKDVDLNECINKSIFVLTPAINSHKITVSNRVHFEKYIKSLQSEIIQVFINIINNAIDALSEVEGQREIMIDSQVEVMSMQLSLFVIRPMVLMKPIWKRYLSPIFSTKKEKNGTGLGLYMSKTIVEEHCKGKLEVRNYDERG